MKPGVTGKTRVVFLDPRYHAFYGAQRSLFTLVTNLPREKFAPVVLLPGEGIVATEYRRAGIEVAVIPLAGLANQFGGIIPRLPLYGKVAVGLSLLIYNLKVAYWLLRKKIDAVYANDLRAVMYVGLAAKLLGKPLLWYVRGIGQPSLLSSLGLRLADKVILIADGVRGTFSEQDYERHLHKFVKLYTGFDVNTFALGMQDKNQLRNHHGIPVNALVLGLVGSITRNKGHEQLIRALGLLGEWGINTHVLFIGDSPVGHEDYRKLLEGLMEELQLTANVHWIGYQDRVAEYYQALDVLVLPSRSEGLPRVVVEALAAGLPVVASDVGGVKEILTSEQLGRVVPPDNVEALAKALKNVLQNREMYSEQYRALRQEYVQKQFSIEAYVRGFEKIVKSVI